MAGRADIVVQLQNRTAAELRQIGSDMARTSRETDRALRSFEQLSTAERRAALVATDHAGKVRILQGALAQTSQGTLQYYQRLGELTRAEQAAERSAGGFKNALSAVQSVAGAAGIGIGARELIQFGASAVESALSLRRAETSTRAITGTTAQYNAVIALARENQELFGGAIADNISQLSGFAVTARRTGVSIAQLNDISQRLAVLSPEQGAVGASIALNEAFSGNTSSLERRFEIPREALKKLKDESLSASDKLKILSEYLDKAGVSSEAVRGSVDSTTRSIHAAQAEVENLKIALGERLAPTTELTARGLTRVLGSAGGMQAALESLKLSVAENANRTQDWRLYLTPLPPILDAISTEASKAAIALGLIPPAPPPPPPPPPGTYDPGPPQDYAAAIARLDQQQREGRLAQIQHAAAVQQSAVEQGIAAAQAEELRLAQERLAKEAKAAADRLLKLGKDGQAAAEKLAGSTSDVDKLTLAYYNLATAKQAAELGPPTPGTTPSDVRAQDQDNDKARRAAQLARDLEAARRRQLEATGSTADRIAAAKGDLAKLTPGTAAYIDQQTKVLQLERQLAEERRRATTAGTRDAKQAATEAKRQADADIALLDTQDQLIARQKQLAGLNPASVEYKKVKKEILDLERQIGDEQERQAKNALDARLAAVDDARARLDEAKELNTARRVLATAGSSEDAKARARLVLERIPLEQQKRALEIAEKTRDAGGVPVPVGAPPPAGVPAAPGLPRPPAIPGAPAGSASAAAAAGAAGTSNDLERVLAALRAIQIRVEVDGQPAANRVFVELSNGLAQAKAAGQAKR